MALFSECMQWCARVVLDTAPLLEKGDFTPIDQQHAVSDDPPNGIVVLTRASIHGVLVPGSSNRLRASHR